MVPASGWLSDWLTLVNQRRKTYCVDWRGPAHQLGLRRLIGSRSDRQATSQPDWGPATRLGSRRPTYWEPLDQQGAAQTDWDPLRPIVVPWMYWRPLRPIGALHTNWGPADRLGPRRPTGAPIDRLGATKLTGAYKYHTDWSTVEVLGATQTELGPVHQLALRRPTWSFQSRLDSRGPRLTGRCKDRLRPLTPAGTQQTYWEPLRSTSNLSARLGPAARLGPRRPTGRH